MPEAQKGVFLPTILLAFFTLFPVFISSVVQAGTFPAFGPESYTRSKGSPVSVLRTFSVLNPNTTYLLQVSNDGVSSATVTLNGIEILRPPDFNKHVAVLEQPVTLATNNDLVVELHGKPGGSLTVQIIGVDDGPPTITASVTPPPNVAGWHSTAVAVTFSCNDPTSGIASCPSPVTVATEGANQVVFGTAIDRAGNSASTSVTLNIDATPPLITVTSPGNGTTVRGARVRITGTVTDVNTITSLTANGTAVELIGNTFGADLTLTEGPQSVDVAAQDIAGNSGVASANFTVAIPPVVVITSPSNLLTMTTSPVAVSGTIDDPAATVVVNGVPATVSGGTFTANGVPLREGVNTLAAVATDPRGNVGTSSITVVLDTTPPTLLIDLPSDGAILTASRVTVTGTINDIAPSVINAEEATVTINGSPAVVAHGTFLAKDVPLQRGPNVITAVGRDRVGNSRSTSITVTLQEPVGQRITLVSGGNQTGVIGSTLPAPLVVALTNATGQPILGRPVTFTVSRGDGLVSAGSQPSRNVVVRTDGAGQAQVWFTLGSRTGAGAHLVTATAAGFAGEAQFMASAINSAPIQINTVSGENQRGEVGQPLPEPFAAVVHDAGGNPVAGVPVTFQVIQGGGSLAGQPSVTLPTDSEGRVVAVLTLGLEPGLNNNRGEASFDGLTGLPATFTASGAMPGRLESTTFSGIVLDNLNLPIEGVTVRIEGTDLEAVTDEMGKFMLEHVPVGPLRLRVNGATTSRPGRWPVLEFRVLTIAGQDNTLGRPIFLLPLDADNAKAVGGSQDVTLTMRDVPGFALTVFANSATFPDGSRVGQVMVTQVHHDKVPMPPIAGAAPRLVWTVQPAGVLFDPPARLTYPNIDNLAPGQVVDLFSFDHDLGEFISIGTGSVSADGAVITSDPGVGIRKSGWGYARRPPPPTTVAKGPARKTTELPPPLADPRDAALNTNCKDIRKADQPVFENDQNKFNGTIREAFETITESGLTVEEFKGLIGIESSFDPAASSGTGAEGLLQFTKKGQDDVNMRPGDLGENFDFNKRDDPNQAIPAGLRTLEIARERLTGFFKPRGGNPPENVFKTLQIAVYNSGFETMRRALEKAGATNKTTFNDLITPPEGKPFADTPLYKAIQELASANGIKSDPPSSADLERRFIEIRNYPDKVLGIAATCR